MVAAEVMLAPPVPVRRFGATGPGVAIIGQGTFLMEHDDPRRVTAALRAGIDLGMSHVDTAELYGQGLVETLVGEAIRGLRDRVYLVSKVLPSNATREGTIAACERSLRRLGTDHLDCYLLHWPGSHPLAATVEGFETLLESGKIRSYGVSNFGLQELSLLLEIVEPGRIACNQILYHLAERTSEHDVIPRCEAEGIAIVGYTPFGRTTFPPQGGASELARLAEQRGVTPRQLALAFLTRRTGLFAIPKAAHVDHLRENALAAQLTLTEGEIASIDAAFPVGPPRHQLARI